MIRFQFPFLILLLFTSFQRLEASAMSIVAGKSFTRSIFESQSTQIQPFQWTGGIFFHNRASKTVAVEWGVLYMKRTYLNASSKPASTSNMSMPILLRFFSFHWIGFGLGGYINTTYQQQNTSVRIPYIDVGLAASLSLFLPLTRSIRLLTDARIHYSAAPMGPQRITFLDAFGLLGLTLGF